MPLIASPSEKATLETITHVHHWAPGLYSFRTTRPANFAFTAGQYARLGLTDANGAVIWRAYSIVSSTSTNELEYYVIDVPSGAFTSMLRNKQVGDSIWVEKQVYGFMTPNRFTDGEDLWMLATGTGLGPFLCILQEPEVWTKFRHLVLVHSVRHHEELAYDAQLRALKATPPFASIPTELHIVQTVTRETRENSEGRLHGRITTLLQNGELESAAGIKLHPDTSRLMLCGNPQMVEEVRKLLHERGMKPVRRSLPGQFLTENYW